MRDDIQIAHSDDWSSPGPGDPPCHPAFRALIGLIVCQAPELNVVADAHVIERFREDAVRAELVLEHYHDMDAWLIVRFNARGWLQYMAAKHPNKDTRAFCAEGLKIQSRLIRLNTKRANEHLKMHKIAALMGGDKQVSWCKFYLEQDRVGTWIAKRLGLSRDVVYHIKNSGPWSHVPAEEPPPAPLTFRRRI